MLGSSAEINSLGYVHIAYLEFDSDRPKGRSLMRCAMLACRACVFVEAHNDVFANHCGGCSKISVLPSMASNASSDLCCRRQIRSLSYP